MLIPIGIVQPQCLPDSRTFMDKGAWVDGGVTKCTASILGLSNTC